MPKVLIANKATPPADSELVDYDDFTTSSSILEFLTQEQECCSEADAESIFQEVSRLADNSDTRSVDEILREAELLIQQQTMLGKAGVVQKTQTQTAAANMQNIKMNAKYTKLIENVRPQQSTKTPLSLSKPQEVNVLLLSGANHILQLSNKNKTYDRLQTPTQSNPFTAFVDNLPSESIISEESTPNDMMDATIHERNGGGTELNDDENDDTEDCTDTMEEISEGIANIELLAHDGSPAAAHNNRNVEDSGGLTMSATNTNNDKLLMRVQLQECAQRSHVASSPTRRAPLNFNATQACSPSPNERRNSGGTRRSSMTTPDSGIGGQTQSTYMSSRSFSPAKSTLIANPTPPPTVKSFCDKSINSSPKHFVSTLTSPIESTMSVTREHALKQEISLLQEKFKDTEERLQSLRIQHDSLSQLQRDLRENNTRLQEESELLKLDVQHLNECANVLRTELQAARADRNEALDLQQTMQTELDESRQEKKRLLEQKDKDGKTIQDLQRQCREMERILMRKHPDSVSALIVASKNSGKCSSKDQENVNSRRLLEQRIAQLEADAKEQDLKGQQILANVQARFNSVQAKYETHIADLETQVLSLQEINTKLNEKIESQVRTLDYFVTKKAEKFYNNCTQTDPLVENQVEAPADLCSSATQTLATMTATGGAVATRDHGTNTIGTTGAQKALSANSSTSSTANSTPNTSRPNSKQSGLRKPFHMLSSATALNSKLPVSQSDSTISMSAYHAAAKEDAHLLATIRGMRVDLAIKDKAMQRLSRELDECKKTIRKMQKEKDGAMKCGISAATKCGISAAAASITATGSGILRRSQDELVGGSAQQALREAQSKIRLLEADYKSLHDKRLQDLKILQTAHERELATSNETMRALQQRLNERDDALAMQKRRKVPVDYYALKAKVTSLERRHSEREERLHMLVDALSKGRLNGALEDLLTDNNNHQ